MKIDNSFDRYFGRTADINYQRYEYSVSKLFGDVLDIGCGDGFGIYLMKSNHCIESIIGIDINKEAIRRAKTKLNGMAPHLMTGDVLDLPFHNDSFDSVHCGQTLEHVKDDIKAIEEIYRVTRGIVVISVPIKGGISEQHLREYDEMRIINLMSKYFKIINTKMFAGKYKRLVLIGQK